MELIFCYPWPGRLLSMGCRSNGIQHLEPSKNIPEWFYGNLCTPQITTTICRPFFGDDKELHVFNSKFLVVRCVLECQGVPPPIFGMPGVALEVQGEASQNGKRHEVYISLHVCLWGFPELRPDIYQRYISMYISIYTILCIIIRLYDIQNHYRWNTASRIITTGNPLKPSTNPSKLPSRTELRLSKRAGKKTHAVRGIDIAKVKRKERRCLFVFPLGRGKIPLGGSFWKWSHFLCFLVFPHFFLERSYLPKKTNIYRIYQKNMDHQIEDVLKKYFPIEKVVDFHGFSRYPRHVSSNKEAEPAEPPEVPSGEVPN